ncbi:MAG TPA: hypothetical protein PKC18_15645 [Lacipirellulaceae bacterium]|nr:hypothetical protein [Lacipirellulaceae bacterium]
MTKDRSPRQAALVVNWPHRVPAPPAREMARLLAAARLPATWSLDQTTQIEALASWGALRGPGAEAALLAEGRPIAHEDLAHDGAAREITRRLELLRGSGLSVDVVQCGPEMASGAWPRTLRALGIRGAIVDGSGMTRALPFGVWLFAPQTSLPRARSWRSWLQRRPPPFRAAKRGPALAIIDLAAAGAVGSRRWREVEQTVADAAEIHHANHVALTTVGQIAHGLAQANQPRPQRSVLRTAA